MVNENWVIAGKPDDTVPVIGNTYEIRHTRKGTFVGRVIEVNGYWAEIEVLSGKVGWAVNENRLFNRNPEVVAIRASLSYLIERELLEEYNERNS